jgi:thioredoxin-dependent peroxiredoxin
MQGKGRGVVGILASALIGLLLTVDASALEVGQKAPDFTLQAGDGKPVKLGDLLGKGPVVVFTFIQAFTGP